MSAASVNDPGRQLLQLPYTNLAPTPKQAEFMLRFELEVLYGGAAGGGKSFGLLMAFLMFADIPGYAGLIVRKRRIDLDQPGGLMELARIHFGHIAEFDSATSTWTFRSGATLTFGYLDSDLDIHQYLSSQYQYIAFDELTEIKEDHYRELFGRLRRPSAGEVSRVPPRMRAATNPGGPGHDWVKRRWIDPGGAGAVYIQALPTDNPELDWDQYKAALEKLPPVRRDQLMHGDWSIQPDGRMFERAWFDFVDEIPERCREVRAWDLAATAPTPTTDPDYTVGARVARSPDGDYYIVDIARFRTNAAAVRNRVRTTAEADGKKVHILLEQEPGSSGKSVIDDYKRDVLDGHTVHSVQPTGPKEVRAEPVAAKAGNGLLHIVKGPWNDAFLDEIVTFPDGAHDDQVDAVAYACDYLAQRADREVPAAIPLSNPRKSPWDFSHPDAYKPPRTQTHLTWPDDDW